MDGGQLLGFRVRHVIVRDQGQPLLGLYASLNRGVLRGVASFGYFENLSLGGSVVLDDLSVTASYQVLGGLQASGSSSLNGYERSVRSFLNVLDSDEVELFELLKRRQRLGYVFRNFNY